MNKLRNIFKQPDGGLVEKEKGKGIAFFRKTFMTRTQRLRLLMEDSDVEFLMLMAYNQRGEDFLTGEVADTGLEVVWENPLSKYSLSDGQLSVASELLSIANAHRDDTEPEYGELNGRIDREVDLAMVESWNNGNVPVELPLPVEKR